MNTDVRFLIQEIETFHHACGQLQKTIIRESLLKVLRQATLEESQEIMNLLSRVESDVSSLLKPMNLAVYEASIGFDLKCMGKPSYPRKPQPIPAGGRG